MYRLLVADDEKKLLSGLCDFYPWKELGFQIVARAENGQEVLEYLSRNPVDVVFTDISMPVMSGMELAEILYREYPEVKVVFLSGYADFKYAQQALKFGLRAQTGKNGRALENLHGTEAENGQKGKARSGRKRVLREYYQRGGKLCKGQCGKGKPGRGGAGGKFKRRLSVRSVQKGDGNQLFRLCAESQNGKG